MLNKSKIYTINIELNNKKIGTYTIQDIDFTEEYFYFLTDNVSENIDEFNKEEHFNIINFIKHNDLNKNNIFLNKKILYLDDFKINKEYQNKNIGSKTLEKIYAFAEKAGFDYIILHPYPIGEIDILEFDSIYNKLISFYKKNNYEFFDEKISYAYMYRVIKR